MRCLSFLHDCDSGVSLQARHFIGIGATAIPDEASLRDGRLGMSQWIKSVEFVGLLIDLAGLTVLLAADVPRLNFLADRMPGVRQRKETLERIREEFSPSAINPDSNVSYQPMFDLTGDEAHAILELFSMRRTRLAPLITLSRSVEDRSGHTGFPDPLVKITLSKDPNEASLAMPVPRSELERRAEKRLHDLIYRWGFSGMFVGALIQMIAVLAS